MNNEHPYVVQFVDDYEKNLHDLFDRDANKKFVERYLGQYLGYEPEPLQLSMTHGIVMCLCFLAMAPDEDSFLVNYTSIQMFRKTFKREIPDKKKRKKFCKMTKKLAAMRLSEVNNRFPVPNYDDLLYAIQCDVLDTERYLREKE